MIEDILDIAAGHDRRCRYPAVFIISAYSRLSMKCLPDGRKFIYINAGTVQRIATVINNAVPALTGIRVYGADSVDTGGSLHVPLLDTLYRPGKTAQARQLPVGNTTLQVLRHNLNLPIDLKLNVAV